jgi:hypothetical protein
LIKKLKRKIKLRRINKMGYNQRGVRDGTGPHKDSAMRRSGSKVGRRKIAGQKCPVKKKGVRSNGRAPKN